MITKRLAVIVPLLAALLSATPAAFAQRSHASPAAATPSTPAQQGSRAMQQSQQPIDIAVTSEGFVPSRTNVKVGSPVTLRITRKVERTCATEVVIRDFGINKPLPLNQTVEVTFTPTRPGKIRFACAMDMIAGELVAE